MKTKLIILILASIALLISACGETAPPSPESIGNIERGQEIFETGAGLTTQICANCHSLDGSILKESNPAPSLQGVAALAGERVPNLSAVDYLKQSIVDPSAYVVDDYSATMDPSYAYVFSEEDLNDLVAFMLAQ
jgi:mono/diheme cytochrome c family protein